MIKTITKTVDIDIDIDTDDVIDEISTEDLIAELESRDDYQEDRPDWDRLYQLLATKRDAEVMQLVREMVEKETGRIVP